MRRLLSNRAALRIALALLVVGLTYRPVQVWDGPGVLVRVCSCWWRDWRVHRSPFGVVPGRGATSFDCYYLGPLKVTRFRT